MPSGQAKDSAVQVMDADMGRLAVAGCGLGQTRVETPRGGQAVWERRHGA
ncbi:hypothetical protein ACE1SV_07350 [Streptomyces sennicomposti]